MNGQIHYRPSQPNGRGHSSTPTSLPPAASYDARQDSVVSGGALSASDWQLYHTSMTGTAAPTATTTRRPLKRARTHQRTPSASTVASNGPASPYTANLSYPHIANTDHSPNSPVHYADQALFSKDPHALQHSSTADATFLPQGYVPSQLAHTPNAHLAMQRFAIDHHNADDFPPEFVQSSRQSMSSGHDSPATPQSGVGDSVDSRNFNLQQNGEIAPDVCDMDFAYLHFGDADYRHNPNIHLFRTESQAYQDELYNPQNFTSTPAPVTKRQQEYLSPHRNLVTERLFTANLARSGSPSSAVSRERSPFRDGSPLAPSADWHPAAHPNGTAAGMRQQQKEEAEQAEYARNMPQLQREPTKTISPKDAVLDYTETDQMPLFQDHVPAGYRPHTGGTETWQGNFVNQPTSTFGTLSAPVHNPQQMNAFAASADTFNGANFGYVPLPPTQHDQSSQISGLPYQSHNYASHKMDYSETNPPFPATLTSMESSVSEGAPPTSQESYTTDVVQRPVDTRANTGGYTCTYHGCTQRFDSHINLQKHKRDFHRSTQHREATSTEEESTSARSTESPAPSGSGMTSAQILARNSQAGPHKCSRTNPSTGKPCNTIFSRPYDLTRHEDTIHNGRKQKVRCPICREEKTFSRNDALTRHMRVVHPEVEAFGKRRRD